MSDPAKLEILIDIKARIDELVKSQEAFRQTKAEAQSFGNMLKTGLGIDLARRGVELFKNTILESVRGAFALASSIKDQAENLQLTTEAYQVLGKVVKDAGGDMHLLSLMIAQSNRSLAEARTLSGPAANAYRSLGLDPAQLEGMAVETRLEKIGRAIASAKDQTVAYGAASQIVGSRNLPTLLGSLRSLAADGYDNVAAAANNAGQVMGRETILRLALAQKQLEEFKNKTTIIAAETIAQGESMMDLLKRDFGGVMSAYLKNAAANFTRVGSDWSDFDAYIAKLKAASTAKTAAATKEEEERRREIAGSVAKAEQTRRNALADAELAVAKAQINRELDEGNPLLSSEAVRREKVIAGIRAEVEARKKLLELVRASPLENETPQQRALRLAKMQAEVTDLNARGVSTELGGYSKMARTNDAYEASGRQENSYQNPMQGLMGGYKQWATQLGSTGDQVATALQGTLGTTVGSITDQLTSAITQTQTWGQALNNIWRSFGTSMIQAFIQMVAQWAVSKTAMFAIDALFAAKSLALSLAGAAKSLVAWIPAAIAAAISSYGVAAIIGAAAVVGAIAAFREQGGPVEAGKPYIVGEKRPEVFVPNQSGTIVPSVDSYRAMQRRGGGGATAGSTGGMDAMTGKQKLLVVYTDHSETVEGLKRRPDFEALVIDINRRNLGEIAG